MAINYPGPYEVRINYVTDEPAAIAAHQLRLSCFMGFIADPGDPFTDWIPRQKDGDVTTTLAAHTDALVAVTQNWFNVVTDIVDAELWEYAPGTFDAIFRSSYSIGLPGTSALPTAVASQSIISFRSIGGGIMKVDLRGTVKIPAITQAYPFVDANALSMAAHIISPDSVWWARDNSYAIAPLLFMPGQNERAWKKLFRP